MLDEKTISEIKKIIFQFLNPKRDKVFIFGSRVIGGSRKFSDVDIGIQSSRKFPQAILGDLKEAFEESNIPYSVDIVDLDTVSKEFRELAMQKIIKLN